ncbi:MAG: DegT/DnrJ/EryC1/StrS aminotransferase family protein, partial [Pseudomonadota bacterium]
VAQSVLASGKVNYWTGDWNAAFESQFAEYIGSRHAIAAANGSLALDLALIALGIGAGDEVIVTPRSYFASVSSVMLTGARPVFADVDRDSQNVTAESIAKVMTPRTRAVMPVHLAGWPCDMPGIMALAEQHGLAVIEDCAQAHGASIDGVRVGAYGHAAGFSFCQDKIMTTGGEGGMFTTNNDAIWRRAWSFKDHGKDFDTVKRKDHPPGFRWQHHSIGNNFRMTEMQAAIGCKQLEKLPDWVARRRANAGVLRRGLASLDLVRIPWPSSNIEHAAYKFYVFVRPAALRSGWTRDRLMTAIGERGVPCFSGSCPEIYRERAIIAAGCAPDAPLPVARELGETSLMFLVHPTINEAQMANVLGVLVDIMKRATR